VRETQITAPVDGVIFDRQVAPGALVGPTSPIVTIVPPKVEVAVNVDEVQLGQVQQGQSVDLTVPAYPDQVFKGTVTAIAPAVDPKTRTASVRIEPSDDQASKLKPGMLATVRIVTAQRGNTLVVPREALQGTPSPNSPSSVVALDGDRAVRRAVSIGLLNDRFAEVTNGLSEGQVVALGNALGLNNGDAVVPQLRTATVSSGL
jgi:RND family efflux transporter MFP subunit